MLEIGGRAILALMGRDIERAREFCAQAWFAEELATYRSLGHPIWDGTAELRVRRANAHEAAELRVALCLERACRE